ncbi:hypothetical protein N1851_003838 [Merluccius polli]|uniref:Uncharacterized protein n=1 Tax=Merluccius polli TaxID=89951 RepID=A0AA47P7R9_MERPO|nr:hypothetical protein N1851_003838 [Merluccius polli]
MESICLTTVPLLDRHMASNIAQWLEEVAWVMAAANILEEKHRWLYLATHDQFSIEAPKH